MKLNSVPRPISSRTQDEKDFIDKVAIEAMKALIMTNSREMNSYYISIDAYKFAQNMLEVRKQQKEAGDQ